MSGTDVLVLVLSDLIEMYWAVIAVSIVAVASIRPWRRTVPWVATGLVLNYTWLAFTGDIAPLHPNPGVIVAGGIVWATVSLFTLLTVVLLDLRRLAKDKAAREAAFCFVTIAPWNTSPSCSV